MARILINDLASVLNERRDLNKKDATNFINELFNLIQESLEEDRLVKVKGLGTFKIIEVDDRESVNVNTGERVLIEGHDKISFAPDALMKELVNKPFSQFETVVLNEGVDFADMPEEPEEAEEQVAAEKPEMKVAPVVTEKPVIDEKPVVAEEASVKEEPVMIEDEESAKAPLVDFTSESEPEITSEPEDPIAFEETAEEVSVEEKTPVEEEVQEDEEMPEEEVEIETSGFNWKKWLLPVIFCLIVFAGGYLFGKFAKGQKEAVPEKVEQKSAPDQKKPETDLKQPVAESSASVEKDATVAEISQKEETVAPDKYDEMDIRVRTGAYRIVGLDHMVKVRSNDNLTKICKRTVGPGMECYLEVFNGIKSNTKLKAGDEIKIPKLELRKKKAKKQE
jgi:nucleoid DNA-binding protein